MKPLVPASLAAPSCWVDWIELDEWPVSRESIEVNAMQCNHPSIHPNVACI
jgi:hypothetical protein